jgi:tRNA(fMet)-specific endonuclease VapC
VTLAHLIDTNIAIHLRDGSRPVEDRVGALDALPAISILTRVELEGGVARNPALAAVHRVNMDAILAQLRVLPFDEPCGDAYGRILAATGWSRSRIFDRMIAATAIAHDLTLITMNGRDFSDIPGLALTIWPSPRD